MPKLFATIAAWFVLATLAAGAGAAPAGGRFAFDTAGGNLPKTVRPRHYALSLELDPGARRFSGRVQIAIDVNDDVDGIVLHARELTTTAPVQLRAEGHAPRELQVAADDFRGRWMLRPADGAIIETGSYTLDIAWTGPVQDSGQGLFAVPYKTPGGSARRLLATQLEERYARELFPCFDEPAFRATFELDVKAPERYEVLSNTPATSSELVDADERELLHWRFARTPPMPTYLLAVAVGRFEHLSERIDGVDVSIVTTEGKRAQGRHALDAMRQLLPWMREYFGLRYPLPKLDLLGLPGQMDGAMENWGLITFDDPLLLVDAGTPQDRRLAIDDTIAHELAHQWFGNLVTAAWWDEIWLNEAFATWLAAKASAHFHPGAQLPVLARLELARALERDAGAATRAIRAGPVDEAATADLFDEITYAKGGAVLTMLEQEIGPERFRAGLAAYISERSYSNATAQDLWFHLSNAAGRDIAPLARGWTDQPGYPVIGVARSCVGGNTRLELTQQPFRNGTFERQGLWQVPLRLRHQGLGERVLLARPQQSFTLPGCDESQPVFVNAGGGAFARVRYEGDDARRLAAGLAALPEIDRLVLLDDGFALAQAGQQPVAAWLDALRSLPALPGDAAAAPAIAAAEALAWMHGALAGRPQQAALDAFGIGVLGPLLQRLDWKGPAGEPPLPQRARRELIHALARLGDPGVRAEARRRAAAALAARGPAAIDPPIRAPVLQAAGMTADAPLFDTLFAAFESERSEERRDELLGALGSVEDPALVERALGLALDGRIPGDAIRGLLHDLGEAPGQSTFIFGFAAANFGAFAARTSEWDRGGLLPAAAQAGNDPAQAERLLREQQRLAPAGQAAGEKAAERIRQRAAFAQREAAALAAAVGALR